MKRIEAIIRKTKFEDVKEALLQSDIDWFEYHNVHGIGQSREERIYRGVQYSTDVIERVALTIVCRDQFVEPTVKVILDVAHTGEVGQGEGAAMAGPGAVEKTDGAALSGAAQRKQPQGGELNDGDLSAWNSAWMGEWEWVLTYPKFERIVRERRR